MLKRGVLRAKALFFIIILIIAIIYLSYNTKVVKADENVCCEKTIAGNYCEYTNEANCDVNFKKVASSCDKTDYCSTGCCVTSDGCYPNVGKSNCEANNGVFSLSSDCSVSECGKGCCVLGGEYVYTTENECNRLASEYNTNVDFRSVNSELECISLGRLADKGCCLTKNEAVYTTREQCNSLTGNFYFNQYCSSVSSNCKARDHKNCIENEDDVYWFDSCNNQEEIAEDCDYSQGTLCKEVDGEYNCKSMDCEETFDNPSNDNDGVARKNGESWCDYDGATGFGRDLVGSRHYRHMCVNGEEIIESCTDFRQQYCSQGVINTGNEEFKEAICIDNDWSPCITECNQANPAAADYSVQLAKDKQCCEKQKSCVWSGDASSGLCLPLVPAGFRHWEGEEQDICGIAALSVPVVWVKKSALDDWDLEGNKHVIENKYFASNFDNYCKSLGDCGAYYNYIGEFTTNGYSCTSSKGSCTGSLHGDSYNLDTIYKEVFGSWNDLQKPGGGLDFGDIDADSVEGWTAGAVAAALFIALAVAKGTLIAALTAVYTTAASACVTGICAVPVVGWILLAIVIILFILSKTADQDQINFNLQCNPWQAPTGGSDCSKCDENKERPCSEYRCKSLGQACEYIFENEGSNRQTCFNAYPNDVNSPAITPWYEVLTQPYSIEDLGNGYNIKPDIEPYTKITFGIRTNELSQCKLSTEINKKYSEKTLYFGNAYYDSSHNISLVLDPGNYTYYTRCTDKAGNENNVDYTIKFKIKEGPDLTAPIIEETSVENNAAIPYGVEKLDLSIFLNEPSDCKWSKSDVAYEVMTNEFSCQDDRGSNLRYQDYYECSTTLPVKETLVYYFRCKDKSNNVNSESYKFSLKESTKLEIIGKEPIKTVYTSNVKLKLVIIGGSDNGVAECRFNDRSVDYNLMNIFFKTNSNTHEQDLVLNEGSYDYYVECKDNAGNNAKDVINVIVDIDTNPPKIKYMYNDGYSLHIITNEITNCEYSNAKFEFGKGSKMLPDNSVEHSAELQAYYYIICEDLFKNRMGVSIYT